MTDRTVVTAGHGRKASRMEILETLPQADPAGRPRPADDALHQAGNPSRSAPSWSSALEQFLAGTDLSSRGSANVAVTETRADVLSQDAHAAQATPLTLPPVVFFTPAAISGVSSGFGEGGPGSLPLDPSGSPASAAAPAALGTERAAPPHPPVNAVGFGLLMLDGTATRTVDIGQVPAGLSDLLSLPGVAIQDIPDAVEVDASDSQPDAPAGLQRLLSNVAREFVSVTPADAVVTNTAAEPTAEPPLGMLDLGLPKAAALTGAPGTQAGTVPGFGIAPAVNAQAVDAAFPQKLESADDSRRPSPATVQTAAGLSLPQPEAQQTGTPSEPPAASADTGAPRTDPAVGAEGAAVASGRAGDPGIAVPVLAPAKHQSQASVGAAGTDGEADEGSARAQRGGERVVPAGLRSASGAGLGPVQSGTVPLASTGDFPASIEARQANPTAGAVTAGPVGIAVEPSAEARQATRGDSGASPAAEAGGAVSGHLAPGAHRPGSAVSRAVDGPPAVQSAPPEFADRLARTLVESHQTGRPLQVRLHPPELGLLQIELSSRGGALSARLDVESTAARQVILEQLPQLRDALVQTGHNVERIDVHLLERSESQPQPDSRGRHQQQESPGEEPRDQPDEPDGRRQADGDHPPGFAPHFRTRLSAAWEQFDLQV